MAAYYYKDGNLLADEPIKIVEMRPGWDGVVTGVVENTEEDCTVRLYLKLGSIYADMPAGGGTSRTVYWALFGVMGLLIVGVIGLLIKRRKCG